MARGLTQEDAAQWFDVSRKKVFVTIFFSIIEHSAFRKRSDRQDSCGNSMLARCGTVLCSRVKVGYSPIQLIYTRHMAFGASPVSLLQGGLATSLSVAEGIAGKLNAAAAKDIIETKARIDHFIGQDFR